MSGSFLVRLAYDSPNYWLSSPSEVGIEVPHPNGTTVGFGYTPKGRPQVLTQSAHDDDALLALIGSWEPTAEPETDPADLRVFAESIRDTHRTAAHDVMGTLRWMLLRPGGRRPVLRRVSARYRSDAMDDWQPFPLRPSAPLGRTLDQVLVTDQWSMAIAAAVAKGSREPLAHELLREAEEALDANPRSSSVLMMAALEAGLDRQPGRIADAHRTGLLARSQRGPAASRPYAGEIHGDIGRLLKKAANLELGRWRELPRWTSSKIEAGRLARNSVVHEGANAPPREILLALRRTVQDVLYLLDYQAGEDWAMQYVAFDEHDGDIIYGTPVFALELGDD